MAAAEPVSRSGASVAPPAPVAARCSSPPPAPAPTPAPVLVAAAPRTAAASAVDHGDACRRWPSPEAKAAFAAVMPHQRPRRRAKPAARLAARRRQPPRCSRGNSPRRRSARRLWFAAAGHAAWDAAAALSARSGLSADERPLRRAPRAPSIACRSRASKAIGEARRPAASRCAAPAATASSAIRRRRAGADRDRARRDPTAFPGRPFARPRPFRPEA